MFKRNKQKGFISAELGIGILVISLLTIMGFLAAKDLDDEISRAPSKKEMVEQSPAGKAFACSLNALQDGINSGEYSNNYDQGYSPSAISNKLGLFPSNHWKTYASTVNGIGVTSTLDNNIRVVFSPSTKDSVVISLRLMKGSSSKYLAELKSWFPKFVDNIACSDSVECIFTQTIKAGDNWLVKEEENPLDGTWMGDL